MSSSSKKKQRGLQCKPVSVSSHMYTCYIVDTNFIPKSLMKTELECLKVTILPGEDRDTRESAPGVIFIGIEQTVMKKLFKAIN